MIPEQANHPISIQCPRIWFLILLNCEKKLFVSCTSNLLEQMYDFQKTHYVPPGVDFESSRPPAKSESWNSPNLHCLAVLPTWQCCLHSHVSLNVRYQSIQAFVNNFGPFCDWSCKFCALIIEYQVVQFVPSVSISEQFESTLVTILQQISLLFLWIVGHRCKD